MGIANARLEAAELQIRQNGVLRSHLLSPNILHKMSQRMNRPCDPGGVLNPLLLPHAV